MESGTCEFGCRIAAKSSIDVTYVPKAEATGKVTIRPNCMAREITVGSEGKARSVVYFDANGREQEIAARAIVVAGNAVETPRLLLMSTSRRYPRGLANSSGLVGKYFTEHLDVNIFGVFAERVDPWRGVPAGGIAQDFYETNQRNGFVRGWMMFVNNSRQWPLSTASSISGWGLQHKARMKEMFGHAVGLAGSGEQLPDIRNQVTLDPQVKDVFGLPVPRLTLQPQENDRALIQSMGKWLREILQAAGASQISEPSYNPGGSSHYLGSCRMGTDPRISVVNPWCRTYDVSNLFIGDGSVFVTGASVNPALTISALATRTAEAIVIAFGRREL
jgi:choline dehydrogenase-like flavoprotein